MPPRGMLRSNPVKCGSMLARAGGPPALLKVEQAPGEDTGVGAAAEAAPPPLRGPCRPGLGEADGCCRRICCCCCCLLSKPPPALVVSKVEEDEDNVAEVDDDGDVSKSDEEPIPSAQMRMP